MHPEDGEVIPPRGERRSRGQGSSGGEGSRRSRGEGRLHYSPREGWVRIPESGFGGPQVSWLGLNRPPPGYPVQGVQGSSRSTRVEVQGVPDIRNMEVFPGMAEPKEPKHVTKIWIQ